MIYKINKELLLEAVGNANWQYKPDWTTYGALATGTALAAGGIDNQLHHNDEIESIKHQLSNPDNSTEDIKNLSQRTMDLNNNYNPIVANGAIALGTVGAGLGAYNMVTNKNKANR